MSTEWTCSQCQHKNPAKVRFCPHCGAPQTAHISTTGQQKNTRRLLWVAALGLWLFGCVIIVVAGGIWWSRQGQAGGTVAEAPPTTEPTLETPVAVSEEISTPTPMPVEEGQGDEVAPTIPAATPSEASTSTGDTLARPTPTPAPEGVILFLSSRDHEPQTEEQRQMWSQHRDLELYAMRPDDSQQTRLSDGSQRWGVETTVLTGYSVPNQVVIGGRYVFDLITRQLVEELTSNQIVDGLPLEFTRGSSGEPPFFAIDPVWLPTGEIVFFGGKMSSSHSIYYLNSVQSKPVRLTNPPDDVWGDGFPFWSPDGKWIVFDRQWNDKLQDGLWIIAKDGSEMRRLVVSDVIANGTRQSAWSPDGAKIAYEGPKKNTEHYLFELWTVDAEGRNPTQLTHLPEESGIWRPVWSPDGQRIAFEIQDRRAFETNIYIVNPNGGEPQQLTSTGTYNKSPLWLPLDADEILAGGDTPLVELPTPTPRPQPAHAQPAKPTNCPSSGVQITEPPAGTRFTRRYNYIVGTANIPRFHHWKIEYSTDPNGGWMYLLERDYPVENDKLVMIDASTVPNGPYGLRLTVVDETGNYPEPCEIWFTNAY